MLLQVQQNELWTFKNSNMQNWFQDIEFRHKKSSTFPGNINNIVSKLVSEMAGIFLPVILVSSFH